MYLCSVNLWKSDLMWGENVSLRLSFLGDSVVLCDVFLKTVLWEDTFAEEDMWEDVLLRTDMFSGGNLEKGQAMFY